MAFAHNQSLKITPSNSPYYRPSGLRSPSKPPRNLAESGIKLKRIIGTTTSSANGFDCLPSTRCFAYTAGAAAVVVQVDEKLNATQSFFRARPTAVPLYSSTTTTNPSTPTQTPEVRTRTFASLHNNGYGGSPISSGSPFGDWAESPSSKTWTARERIKAATSVSLSPDGNYLAVGETGYTPRVLIFSLAKGAPSDIPIASLSEHNFGIRCVAFSPDSRWVASLGTMNDGFLYIWSINHKNGSARLHSTNKCTSNVRHMIWMGNALVTVGTRHVKVWRIDETAPLSPSKSKLNLDNATPAVPANPVIKTLLGRNCLLGPLVDCTFTCAASLSNDKAIVCTEKGDVCLIDDSDGSQRLNKVGHAGFGVNCVAVDSTGRKLRVGGRHGNVRDIVLSEIISPQTPPESPTPRSESPSSMIGSKPAHIVAMACFGGHLLTVDSYHSIKIVQDIELGKGDETDPRLVVPLELTAHKHAVNGVRLLPGRNDLSAAFFTWSSSGIVLFWDLEGKCKGEMLVELEQLTAAGDDDNIPTPNELKVMQASSRSNFFVSGDKYGVLRIIGGISRKSFYDVKAHSTEITDVAIFESEKRTLIASCSRDRTVQLLRKDGDNCTLVQTMDDHQGSVNRLMFIRDGEKLLSCSSDRTILIRSLASRGSSGDEVIAYLIERTLTFKASPVSMAMQSEYDDTLIVSTIDRHIQKFNIINGRNIQTFRTTDSENNDAVVLDALAMSKEDPAVRGGFLAGVSTGDKSIRVYSNAGVCLDRDFGHTESVTDMAMLTIESDTAVEPNKTTLISTGSDGTIMIWDVVAKAPPDLLEPAEIAEEATPSKESTAAQKPLRRILSRSELAEFQKASDSDNSTPVSTPTGRTSPPRTMRRKPSRFSLAQSPKLGIPPVPSFSSSQTSPNPSPGVGADRSGGQPRKQSNTVIRDRSPSPPSPKGLNGVATVAASSTRRPSFDARSRTKSAGNVSEFGSLGMSTEQVCRTLRAYRKKLSSSSDALRPDGVRELERELGLTARALGEREKGKATSEAVLAKLLDQYSEKIADLIDEKIAWRVGGGGLERGRDSREGSPDEKGGGVVPAVTPASVAPTVAVANTPPETG